MPNETTDVVELPTLETPDATPAPDTTPATDAAPTNGDKATEPLAADAAAILRGSVRVSRREGGRRYRARLS